MTSHQISVALTVIGFILLLTGHWILALCIAGYFAVKHW